MVGQIIVALVQKVTGSAVVKDAAGHTRLLAAGDKIYLGETVQTGNNTLLNLIYQGQFVQTIGPDTTFSADSTDLATQFSPHQSQLPQLEDTADSPTETIPTNTPNSSSSLVAPAFEASSKTFTVGYLAPESKVESGYDTKDTNPTYYGIDADEASNKYNEGLPAIITTPINPLNKAPLAVADTNMVHEDIRIAANGNVLANDSDPNSNDVLVVSQINGAASNVGTAVTGVYGSVIIHSNGSYSYSLNNNAPNVQALAEGQTVQDTFSYQISDGQGGTTTSTLTINITGTNDQPIASTDITHVQEDVKPTTSGNILSNDVDIDTNDHLLVTSVNGQSNNVGTSIISTYGSITINADGSYSYTLNNNAANVQALAAGQIVQDTFSYQISDGHGGVATSTLVVTITGTNDAPTVTGAVATGSITELASSNNSTSNDITSGNFTFGDVDLTNSHSVSASAPTNITWSGGMLPTGTSNSLSTALTAALTPTVGTDSTNTNSGTINWTFTAQDKNFDFLAAGQTLAVTYNVTITDNAGATVIKPVTITITGSNDGPTVISTASAANIMELANTHNATTHDIASGNFIFGDVDLTNTHAVSTSTPTNITWSDGTLPSGISSALNTALATALTPSVGTDSTNTGSGTINWTFTAADKNFDFLAVGQTLTVTYNVTITDNAGATVVKPVTITITGTNDGPTATADTANVQEDTTLTNTGNVLTNDNDVDSTDHLTVAAVNGQTNSVGSAITGTYGLVTIQADGSYSYALNTNTPNVQALAAGQTVQDTFTYQISDGHGGTTTSTLTITIIGTNDAPIATADIGNVQEDVALTTTGNVLSNDTDIDTGSVLNVAQVNGAAGNMGTAVAGIYGSVIINSNGSYTYTLNNTSPAVQTLAAGETQQDTFTYQISDGQGGTTTSTLTITITGTNDAPTVTGAAATGSVTELADTNNATTLDSASGSFTFSDVDLTNTHSVSVSTPTSMVWSGGTVPASVDNNLTTALATALTPTVGIDSTNTGSGTINWAFSAQDKNFDFLAAGQTLTVTYNVTITDTAGATVVKPVTITITGTNDGPVAAADASNVQEDATLTTTGNLLNNDSDPDISDLLTVTQINGATSGVGTSVAGTYGAVVINDNGSYTYTLNNSAAAIQALAAGQTKQDIFTYQISDGQGGTTTSTLTITITGTNDGPVATADIGNVQEDATLASTGNVLNNDNDVDIGDLLTVTQVNGASSSVGASITGTYGSVVINSNGSYSYTLNNSAASVQALAAGETKQDVFNYQISDGHGGTTTSTLTITITGTNDAPTVTGTASTGAITELANTHNAATLDSTSGNFTFADVDLTNAHSVSASAPISITWSDGTLPADTSSSLSTALAAALTPSVGTASASTGSGIINWTFTAPDQNFDFLAAGQTLTVIYNVTITDNAGATVVKPVTITITGSNDGPTAVADINHVQENNTLSASGNVLNNDSDIDSTDHLTVAAVNGQTNSVGSAIAGTYGSVTIQADGSYSYALNNNAPNVQALAAGQTVQDTFTYQISDGHGGTTNSTLTITITGTNDAPIAIADVGNVQEDVTLTVTGNVLSNDTDVDTGSVLNVAQVNGAAGNMGTAVTGTYGSIIINSSGSYTYTLNNSSPAVQALAAGETQQDTFTYQVSDGQGGATTGTLTITITGANDAPTVTSAAATGAITELANTHNATTLDAASGSFAFGDVDLTNTHAVSASTPISMIWSGGTLPTGISDSLTTALSAALTSTVTTDSTNAASGTINWAFSASDQNFDFLAAGQTLAVTYNVTITDNSGATVIKPVSITITGTNDIPTVTGAAATGVITELADTNNATTLDNVSGHFVFNDVDLSNTHTVSASTPTSIVWSDGTLPAGISSSLSTALAAALTPTIGTDSTNISSGTIDWAFSAQDQNFDFLAAGQTLTVTYNVTITDAAGATVVKPVTITITGTNDGPVAAADTGNVQEDTALTTAGNVLNNDSDLDISDVLSVAQVNGAAGGVGTAVAGTYGSVIINSNGSYTYTLNNSANSVQTLAAGETKQDVFTYQTSDGQGGITTSTLTITITGTNDGPVAAADTGNVQEDTTLSATGNVLSNDSDPDISNVLSVAQVNGAAGNVGTAVAGTYGSVVINSNGSYTYTLNNSVNSLQNLASGETKQDIFTYQTSDGQGGTTTSTLAITITGTNDTPTVTGTAAIGAITELANTVGATNHDTTSGSFAFGDVDLTNTHSVSASAPTGMVWSGGTLPTGISDSLTTALATALAPSVTTDSTGIGSGTVNWAFGAQDKNFDFLAAGQTLAVTYNVTITDSSGATVIKPVTITITGTNDTPTVTGIAATGAITELANINNATTADSASGNFTFNDVDLSNTHSISASAPTGIVWSGGTLPADISSSLTTALATALTSTVATDSTNTGSGTINWTFSAQDKNFDFLATGQTLTVTYHVTIADAAGATVVKPVTITITGTNDGPVAAVDTSNVQEDTSLTTIGNVLNNDSDIDLSDVLSVTQVNGAAGGVGAAVAGTYGSVIINSDGSYTYTLNNSANAVQALAAGETKQDIFTYQTSDGQGGTTTSTLNITVTGTDDVPTVTSTATTGAITELANALGATNNDTASGSFAFADVDLSNTHTVLASAPTSMVWSAGTLPTGVSSSLTTALATALTSTVTTDSTSTGSGTINWAFSTQDQNFDFLAAGQTLAVTYNVTITDNSGATVIKPVTITVTGTNDAPTVTGTAATGAITELANTNNATTADSVSGNFTFNDVDLTNTHSVSASAPTGVVWSGGTLPAGISNSLTTALTTALTPTVGTDSTNTGSGTINWTFSAQDQNFDFLAAGQTLTVTYNVTITDTSGATVVKPVTITITGTNDGPVAAADTGNVQEDTTLTATGNILSNDSDPDISNVLSVAQVNGTAGGVGTAVAGTYGSVIINSNGSYTYTLNNSAASVQALAAGQTKQDVFTYQTSDGQGGTTTSTLTITITGTNDTPTVSGTAATGAITELANSNNAATLDSASGSFSFNDVDLTNTHTVSASAPTSMVWSGGTLPTGVSSNLTTALATALAPTVGTDSTSTGSGTINWAFSAQDQNFDFLAAGQTLAVTYNVTIIDNSGAAVTKPVTITITGTNDAPTVTGTAATSTITELVNTNNSTTADSVSGNFTFSDADLTNTHTVSAAAPTSIVWSGGTLSPTTSGSLSTALAAALTPAVGTDSTNTGSGTVNWTFSAQDKNFDFLAAGQTLTVTYNVTITDSAGATVVKPVTLTITGTNDGPVAVADTGNVREDTTLTTVGNVLNNDSDPDISNVLSVAQVNGAAGSVGTAVTGTYGSVVINSNGSYTYTLNNSANAVQALAAGETRQDVFTYQTSDGQGGTTTSTLTITITGSNDAPTVTGTVATGTITELTNTTGATNNDAASGSFAFGDVDLTNSHSVSASTPTGMVWSGGALPTGVSSSLTTALATALTPTVGTDSTNTGSGTINWAFSAQDQNFDFLAAGQTLAVTYNVTITDNSGATVTKPVTITVTGTNDVPTVTGTAATGAITELANTNSSTTADSVSGNFTFNDVDLTNTHSVSTAAPTSITWSGGTLPAGTSSSLSTALAAALTPTVGTDSTNTGSGTINWTFSAQDKNFDFLAAGQTLTVTYNVTITDTAGATVVKPVTITITGSNDGPVVAADTNNVQEDTTLTATGNVLNNDSDPDISNVLNVAQVNGATGGVGTAVAGTYGSVVINSNGSYTYTLNNSAASVQALAAGETKQETFTYQTSDGQGGTTTSTLTITITGTNDAPTVTGTAATGAITELTNSNNATTLDSVSGNFSFGDVDLTNTHSVSASTPTSMVWSGGALPTGVSSSLTTALATALAPSVATDSTSTGSGTINWAFSAQDKNFDFLAAGQTLAVTYNVTITDNSGATVIKPVTITITGTNDVPTVTGTAATGAITELANSNNSTTADSVSGSFAFNDVDLTNTHSVSASTPTSMVWSGGTLPTGVSSSLTTALATALTPTVGTDSTNTGSGAINWTFSAQDKNFDFLAAGQTLAVTYNVTITDNSGATVIKLITITVTGTNDAPTVTGTAATGAITELANTNNATTADSVSGNFTFNDVDLTNTHSVSASAPTGVVWSGGTLPAGISSSLSTALATALTSTVATDSTNTGSGTINWTFSAQDKNFDFLAAGQTLTVTYNVTITDTSGATVVKPVTITITGTNDGPVAAADTGNVQEDTTLTATGNILSNDSDPDISNVLSVAQVNGAAGSVGTAVAGTYGSVVINSNGSYTYTLNNSAASVQALAAGQTKQDIFTYQTSDGQGGTTSSTLTITITGTNDAPTVTGTAATGAITELANSNNATTLDSASGSFSFNDVDLTNTHTVSASAPTSMVWSGGTLPTGTSSSLTTALATALTSTVTTDSTSTGAGTINWAFSAQDKNFDFLAAGQTLSVTYNVTITDSSGATVTKPVTITITGTNDVPTVTGTAATGAITELANTNNATTADSASGNFAFNDADLTNTHSVSASAPTSMVWSGGTLPTGVSSSLTTALATALTPTVGTDSTNTGSGAINWTFSAQDKNFDFLASGQTLTVTYNVTITDNSGATVIKPVTITITGTNDAPTVTGTAATGAITELANTNNATTADSASGNFTFNDVDLTNTHSVSASAPTGVVWSGGTLPAGISSNLSTALATALTSTVATDSTNTGSGTINWTFSAQDKNFDFLAAGQTLTVTYNVTITDTSGATVVKPVTITITGTNDGPVAAADTGNVQEDTTLTATGNILSNDSDPDISNVLSVAQVNGAAGGVGAAVAGTYGSVVINSNGSYTYTLNNSAASVQALAAGQTKQDVFTYQTSDGQGKTTTSTLTITITGTNDAPTVTGTAATGAINELANTTGSTNNDTATGNVTFGDVDLTNTHSVSASAPTSMVWSGGTLPTDVSSSLATALSTALTSSVTTDSTNTGSGTIKWTFSAQDKNFDFLAAGQTLAITYNVTITDNAGATVVKPVTITVTGRNDAPTIDLDADDSSLKTGTAYQATYSGTAIAIADTDTTLIDADNANLTSATIKITNAKAGDMLTLAESLSGTGISVSGLGTTTITLTGSSSVANYQAAIEAIRFSNNSSNPSNADRSISVVVNDGTTASNTATSTIHVPVADISITNTFDHYTQMGGESEYVTFNLVVSNNSSTTAANVVITDNLPAGLTYVSSTGPSGYSDGSFGTITLAANGSATYTITAKLPSDYQESTPITSSIGVNSATSWNDFGSSNLYVYNFGTSFLTSDGKLSLSSDHNIAITDSGIGRPGIPNNLNRVIPEQINYDPNTGKSESLAIVLPKAADSVTIEVANLYKNENDGEYGKVSVFDTSGNFIGTFTFGNAKTALNGDPNFIAVNYGTSDNVGTFTINHALLGPNSPEIGSLVFQAMPYGDGVINNVTDPIDKGDASDYFIKSINYTYDTESGTLTNTATVSSDTVDINSANNSSSATAASLGDGGFYNAPSDASNHYDLTGSAGNDVLIYNPNHDDYDGGAGWDILRMPEGTTNITLATSGSTVSINDSSHTIDNVEIFDLTGVKVGSTSGNDSAMSLTLHAADVLNMSNKTFGDLDTSIQSALPSVSTNSKVVLVNGTSNDQVNFADTNNWTNAGSASYDGASYNVYTYSFSGNSVAVLVDNHITNVVL